MFEDFPIFPLFDFKPLFIHNFTLKEIFIVMRRHQYANEDEGMSQKVL